jgi:phosphohistidine phosphatase
MRSLLDAVPAVDLTPSGTFKYILVRATSKTAPGYPDVSRGKTLVRGYTGCELHADVLELSLQRARAVDPDVEMVCTGGGRITHTPPPCEEGRANVFIYGYSQAFGRGDHGLAADMVLRHFDDYKVEWSNDGY